MLKENKVGITQNLKILLNTFLVIEYTLFAVINLMIFLIIDKF